MQCCSYNTHPPQSTTPRLQPVSIHQMAPPVRGNKHPITAYYSVYRPRKDERLSRPGWLVTYRSKVPPPGVEPGHITHPSTNRARRRVTSICTVLPVLWMKSCFHIMGHRAHGVGGRRAAASSRECPTYSPGNATLFDFVVVYDSSKLRTRSEVCCLRVCECFVE